MDTTELWKVSQRCFQTAYQRMKLDVTNPRHAGGILLWDAFKDFVRETKIQYEAAWDVVMRTDDFMNKQVLLSKIKEVFIAHFYTPQADYGSTRWEIGQNFVRAVLKTAEFLHLSPEKEDDYGFMTVWTRRPKMHQMDIWYSFINYAEATFLCIQQNTTANDVTIESIAVLIHLFLSDAMMILHSDHHQCRSLEELKPLAEDARWCDSMGPLNVSKWSEDVVGIDTLANWPPGPRSRLLAAGVFQVDDKFIVKRGLSVTIKEVMALEYVRRNTIIPVPRVYGVRCLAGEIHMVMELVDGQVLSQVLDDCLLDENQIQEIIDQLLAYVTEIRSLECDRDEIGSWPFGLPSCGLFKIPPSSPITSLAKLYSYWEERWEAAEEYRMKWPLVGQTNGNESMVLSHGDLAPRNIIVKGHRIVSIVDWETFGWYPDFWEGMMARRYLKSDSTWWERVSEAMHADGEVAESFWQIVQSVLNRN
ncbi:kinase-like protein [Neolentinus lepideus HHB14362 ss-1]|uniref:Kinase-like protein n=1 Tax=Neolentinus lepideus HHB14362 ss-1 TaxID=1314782 RepID=A0A165RU49_9AGAM|nr:kinase-like protein [Neolentinus lepideus HHB14362 ss-1]